MKFAKELKIKVRLLDELLGTASGNPDLYAEYIASKAPDADKVEQEIEDFDADAMLDKAMTGFPRDDKGQPFLYDYQIRGFFKEAAGFMKKVSGSESSGLKAYKKQIDGLIFVSPRKIPLCFSGFPSTCQRPLRASTPQGDRNALAMSESVPEGSTCEFTVMLALEKTAAAKGKPAIDYAEALIEWLQYGMFKGYGQWRNSGKGRFEFDIE